MGTKARDRGGFQLLGSPGGLRGIKLLLLLGRLSEELGFGMTVLQGKEEKGIEGRGNSWGEGLKEEGGWRLFQACSYPTKTWSGVEPSSEPTHGGVGNKMLGPGLRLRLGRGMGREASLVNKLT